jgi:hypothetical protein
MLTYQPGAMAYWLALALLFTGRRRTPFRWQAHLPVLACGLAAGAVASLLGRPMQTNAGRTSVSFDLLTTGQWFATDALPRVLLPATTALGTIHPRGRELGILAGANVVMPNLSPRNVREKYMLYDNKICTGDEAAECRYCMQKRMESIGYSVKVDRGDYINV